MTDVAPTPPGLMISAPSSGTGKTTVMLGLLRALADEGIAVQPYKSGPDYIDPAFHRAASGRNSFNVDTWAMGPQLLAAVAAQSRDADICVAEGSMGLYDGVATRGQSGFGSSAETAIQMGWPVVLVVDVSGQAQSAAATALGFQAYRPDLPFAGVILNRVASPRHERLARLGMEQAGIKVLGCLPRRGDLVLPERHLGLIQAVEHPDLDAAIAGYADFLRAHVDLAALRDAARGNQGTARKGSLPAAPAGRIALAQDAAFSFTYPHQLEGWRADGAEILPFSPLADEAPDPSADLVWLPGGYPELHAGRLAAATRFRDGMVRHAQTRPVHGECGGYMALGTALIDKDGTAHEMAGLLGLVTSYEKRKFHLGYRRVELLTAMPGHDVGAQLLGHEFHYSTILEQPDAPLARVADADGAPVPETGSFRGHVTGTFFHLITAQEATQ
ncbi:hydrogenobyrinic acid a,c-diamide synthase (glutamine-hydrolysing) /cobyrinate a,c-diamide synthase [Pseudosulfitobacter pseudonitzschiae]|uniref:Hydrogenobyrinate a,c-diamide synthase n=1 Tax=Pseudosulfitobacter pseudonitzschiae TaxID=1402135 RepID=A0A073J072_9RHOB|nr:cobyrinate a,c-diamide synthase [Pseudosulfitobacter pseudonitzschiae]KEJ95275.1 cobyrinic acid a,c-diamide synthase [Pseudosulfitobacter pseudonitzschiae]QKS11569.1 cobyrinate a,c-diamide synthase [Pseudosulfitobacter pseudonitzschiae]SHF92107.1 hydrogenobyrinic acid a,c-diamide synthase (glutamine-hydrolysing) /cobyrinate a,c-diamide synthase [Pseudosulfitobacter pseudonitzschiae]